MNISCYKREKMPKCSEKQTEKANNLCKKLIIDRHVSWFWTMKNILLMIAKTCKETTTTTKRMTYLNVQILFALLEKRNIR